MTRQDDEIDLLIQARARAQRLIDELEEQGLTGPSPRLHSGQLRQGEEARRKAVAAARRTLAAIEAAIQVEQDQSKEMRDDRNRS